MVVLQNASTLAGTFVVNWTELVKLAAFVFACGVVYAQIQFQSRRLTSVEKRTDKIEERAAEAIERLNDALAQLTTELKTVVAVHESRIDAIEKRER